MYKRQVYADLVRCATRAFGAASVDVAEPKVKVEPEAKVETLASPPAVQAAAGKRTFDREPQASSSVKVECKKEEQAEVGTAIDAKRPRRDLAKILASERFVHGTRVLTHGWTDGIAKTFYGTVILSRNAENFGPQHRLVQFDDGEEKVMPLSALRVAK